MSVHSLSLPLPLPSAHLEGRSPLERLLSAAFGRPSNDPGSSVGGTGAAAAQGDECRAAMRLVLEDQIIPRLLRVQRPGPGAAAAGAAGTPSDAEIEAFARVCAAGERAAGSAFVGRLRGQGLQPESMLVDLVAPAARFLGRQWEEDALDFMAVTVGLVVMHELVHDLGYAIQDGPKVSGPTRRVMLASAPGSQHLLGLSIVSEFFRKAGWQVVLEVSPSANELCRAVADEWFDLLGLSVALDDQLSRLPTLVGQLRAASRNSQVPVLLGGPVFFQRGLQASSFGAQAICLDARESVKLAADLVIR